MKKTAQALSVAIIGALTLGSAAELARAECYVQGPLPSVHRSYIRRDVVEPGVYEVVCTVICSEDHEGMHMKFTVVP